jgi:Recombinase
VVVAALGGHPVPLRRFPGDQLRWVEPSYHQVHGVLTNPVYAGAYVFGRRRTERYVDQDGQPRKRVRHLHQADWEVLIWEHHAGYIDRATFEHNQARIGQNAWRTPQATGRFARAARCCRGSRCVGAAARG